ncbi:MAG: class I SAM-dependent methyltransferase [Bacteroidia bacterium]|nr:class I SAM-dependent methyltransferase [Bacteroidia bacterium]MDW8134372.1 class I SAM-dependent methyltransferase [Bacteroidia bacterium]
MEYHILSCQWSEYALLDFGEGWRWEQWGEFSLQRPDGWALGMPAIPRTQWKATYVYHPISHYQGEWRPPLPEKWRLTYYGKGWRMQLWARKGRFKHLGVFPEQAAHWEWLYACLKGKSGMQVLNLFAYTGGASLAAALAGAQVTHVDSSKSALKWAAENARLNQISTIRWIPEDAKRFVERMVRKGRKYYGILLDPPTYGVGAGGRRWELEKDLPNLLPSVAQLLSPEGGLLLINIYSGEISPLTLFRLTLESVPFLEKKVELGELVLLTPQRRSLSTGVYLRAHW